MRNPHNQYSKILPHEQLEWPVAENIPAREISAKQMHFLIHLWSKCGQNQICYERNKTVGTRASINWHLSNGKLLHSRMEAWTFAVSMKAPVKLPLITTRHPSQGFFPVTACCIKTNVNNAKNGAAGPHGTTAEEQLVELRKSKNLHTIRAFILSIIAVWPWVLKLFSTAEILPARWVTASLEPSSTPKNNLYLTIGQITFEPSNAESPQPHGYISKAKGRNKPRFNTKEKIRRVLGSRRERSLVGLLIVFVFPLFRLSQRFAFSPLRLSQRYFLSLD